MVHFLRCLWHYVWLAEWTACKHEPVIIGRVIRCIKCLKSLPMIEGHSPRCRKDVP
jgi:hypothetical protein